MTVTIERATPADAAALLNAQIRAFNHDAVIYPGVPVDGPPGYDSIELMLKDLEEIEFYKILYHGQIVGGITVFDRGEGHFHLDRLFIDPDHHNRGIGSQAMHFIEQTYPAKKWSLHTPTYAVRNHHFYEKFGYRKISEEAEAGTDIILIYYEKTPQ